MAQNYYARTFNICKNWGLYCHEQSYCCADKNNNPTSVRLACSLNGQKREDGSYPPSIHITVFAKLDGSCAIEPVDHSKKKIDVDGGIKVTEYDYRLPDGTVENRVSLTLFADSVRIHQYT